MDEIRRGEELQERGDAEWDRWGVGPQCREIQTTCLQSCKPTHYSCGLQVPARVQDLIIAASSQAMNTIPSMLFTGVSGSEIAQS